MIGSLVGSWRFCWKDPPDNIDFCQTYSHHGPDGIEALKSVYFLREEEGQFIETLSQSCCKGGELSVPSSKRTQEEALMDHQLLWELWPNLGLHSGAGLCILSLESSWTQLFMSFLITSPLWARWVCSWVLLHQKC